MGEVITRDLVRKPEDSDLILGTAVTLQILGGITAAGLSIVGIHLIAPGQPLMHLMVEILALKFVFNSLQPIANWFESRVASKYVVLAEQWAFLLIVCLRCGLVIWQAPILAFAIAIVLESVLYGMGLIFFYTQQHQSIWRWHTNLSKVGYLFQESWPLILPSTAVVIYLNVDQIMLGTIVNSHAVGIYASAAALSEATAFLPVIVGSSLYPRIVQSRQLETRVYHQRLQGYYDLNGLIAYGLIAVLIPSSGFLIHHLYGGSYHAAVPIFNVHIVSCLFTFLGIAQSHWIVSEGLQKYNFYSRLMGLLSNVGINLVLIPRYGGMGAAIATLISYAIGGYLFFWCIPRTRDNAARMTSALTVPLRLPQILRHGLHL